MTLTDAIRQAEAGVVLASSLELPNVTSMAENILTEAMAFYAQKVGIDSVATAADLLRQRDRAACEYCFYGIAKQVAMSLGAMDENVKAVYLLDYDATPEDLCFGTLDRGTPTIHLIVWTERKTAALNALIAVLDRALADACADLLDRPQVRNLLAVQVIDDADVENRMGPGALLDAIHHQPIQIWDR
jgi:hypothetical protein